MRTIDLNAKSWTTVLDFYHALLDALGVPKGYSCSVDALLEFMIWDEIKVTEPPYTIRISDMSQTSEDIRNEIELVKQCVADACGEYRIRKGKDVEVEFELVL